MKIEFRHVMLFLVLLAFAGTLLPGCGGSTQARIPRPRAYPRVEFPSRIDTVFNMQDCPFTFTYPTYMEVVRKDNFFDEHATHPCWFDLVAPSLGATLHCSYYDIGSEKAFDDLVTDAFKMADRITQRANYMDEIRVANPYGVSGVIMEFTGAAASPLHFYLSDSTSHFFKASLYFQSSVVPDSLAPILNFLQEDLATLMNTMQFE